MFDHEHSWAMYTKSTGGDWLSYWYADDEDIFEFDDVTYTRIGPVVKAYTIERARELIDQSITSKSSIPSSLIPITR